MFLHIQETTEETKPFQDALVDLEMDELNQHECMPVMTALIGHMQRNNITPKIEQVRDGQAEYSKFCLAFSIQNGDDFPSSHQQNMCVIQSTLSLFMKQGNTPSDLPPWMKFLHVKLANPATHLNIRLFISKLIINTEEVSNPLRENTTLYVNMHLM